MNQIFDIIADNFVKKNQVHISVKRFFMARKTRGEVSRRQSITARANHFFGATHSEWQNNEHDRPQRREHPDRPSGKIEHLDPFYDNWSDVELSSHNHVDIEDVEIPSRYMNNKEQNENI